MKSKNNPMFSKEIVDKKIELSHITGGELSNKSDVAITDTRNNKGGWDIAYLSVLEIEDTSSSRDKP